MLKRQYAKFCEAWTNERRYQDYLHAMGKPLPEGHNALGKKPTFNMWLKAVKNKKIAKDVTEPPPSDTVNEKKVEVTDSEW